MQTFSGYDVVAASKAPWVVIVSNEARQRVTLYQMEKPRASQQKLSMTCNSSPYSKYQYHRVQIFPYYQTQKQNQLDFTYSTALPQLLNSTPTL